MVISMNILTEVVGFCRSNQLLATLICIAAWLLSLVITPISGFPLLSGVHLLFVALFFIGIVLTFIKLAKPLTVRATNANDTLALPSWYFEVNLVRVGMLSDSDLARLQLHVLTDPLVFARQVVNLLYIATRVLQTLLSGTMYVVPAVLFWLAVYLYYFEPQVLTSILSDLQSITGDQFLIGVQNLLAVSLPVFGVFAIVTLGITDTSIGYVNHYDRALHTRLRQRFACAAIGDTALFRDWPLCTTVGQAPRTAEN